MPFFSIIIVSWNALHHLKTYLPSVVATNYPHYEIILADNASTDGSREWVRTQYPNVKIAELEKNYGYCGGNNRAVPHADGDILLFLNNDVRVDSDWLTALAECFERHHQLAAMQPKMLADKRPSFFEYAGAAGGFLDRFGYPFCRGRIFDTVEEDSGQYDVPKEILWASGAALAIRKDIFNDLGGFDEEFEFHMEEIDLCWRIRNANYKVMFCPHSRVYHLGGGSMPMGSPRKIYYNYRNNLFMLWKNCSTDSLPWRFLGRYLLDIVAWIRSVAAGEWHEAKAIFHAHIHFWKWFPKLHQKRYELQKKRVKTDDPEEILPVNLVWQYFIRGKKKFMELF